ncbi:cyclin A2-like [Arapaima gigas]
MACSQAQAGGAARVSEQGPQNQENMVPRLRVKANLEDQENHWEKEQEDQENANPRWANRTVLGVLHNQQRNRANVLRVSKPVTSTQASSRNEDHCKAFAEKVGSRQPAFQIHVDEPQIPKKQVSATAKTLVENPLLPLNPTVTGLRQPLSTLDVTMDTSFDSPMDMSVIDTEEKRVNVNCVPDYATEIHSYLREMETAPLVEVTGYTLESLTPCITDLHQTYLNASQHAQQSVKEKYKASKYQEVSLIEPPEKLILS